MRRRDFLRSSLVVTAGGLAGCSADVSFDRPQSATDGPDLLAYFHEQAAALRQDLTIENVTAWPVRVVPPRPPADDIHPPPPPGRSSIAELFADHARASRTTWGPFSGWTSGGIVRVETKEGVTGYGLAGGGGAMQYVIDHHLKDLVIGRNPFDVVAIWDHLFALTQRYGRKGLAIMAISGIDLALWDILGKVAGRPVCRLLSPSPKTDVRAYGTGFDVEWNVAHGLTALKLPMPFGPGQGDEGIGQMVDYFTQVREVAGPDTRVMTDCLMGWNVDYALRAAAALRPLDLYWIEEALMPDDYEGYARLCREIDWVRIAHGEHEFTHYGFKDIFHHGAADLVQPDIAWTGGLTSMMRTAGLAAAAGVPVIPHQGATVWGLQAIAAIESAELAETFGIPRGPIDNELYRRIRPVPEAGRIAISQTPGFGVELEEELLREYAAEV